jgi:hypothetical protein
MNSTPRNDSPQTQGTGVSPLLVGLSVVLCVICCALILLIPAASIDVGTVYQGF